jgi:hypothetical protein
MILYKNPSSSYHCGELLSSGMVVLSLTSKAAVLPCLQSIFSTCFMDFTNFHAENKTGATKLNLWKYVME